MFHTRVLVWLAYLTLATAHSTASAQPANGGAAPAGYDEAVDLALQEFQSGNFAEARSQFTKAHEIFPNARTLRALGKTEYELKNYRVASRYLERALASEVRPLTRQQRQEAERLHQSARGYLAHYHISLQPADAKLVLDGAPIAMPDDGTLVLEVGDHTLEALAKGYASERRTLRVVGGRTEQLAFDLRPLKPTPVAQPLPPVSLPAPEASPAAPVEQDGTPIRRKWWLWTGVVGVVAGGAIAAVLLTMKKPEPQQPSGGSLGLDIQVPASLGGR